jgi:hypothetical protein
MREIRTSSSEGGGIEANRCFLPLYLPRLVACTGKRAVYGGALRLGCPAGWRCGNTRVRRRRVMVRRQNRRRYGEAYPNQQKKCLSGANFRDFCCRSCCTFVPVRKKPNQSRSHRLRFRRFPNAGGNQIECRDQRLLSQFLWHRGQPGSLLPRIDIHPRQSGENGESHPVGFLADWRKQKLVVFRSGA